MFAGWRHVWPNYNHIKRAGTGAGFDKTRSPGTGTSSALQHCTQPRLASHITWLLWWLGRVRFVRLVENHHWKWWSKYNLILPFFLRVLFSLATPHIALLRVKIHVYPLPRDPMWPGLGWAGLGWAGLGYWPLHFSGHINIFSRHQTALPIVRYLYIGSGSSNEYLGC